MESILGLLKSLEIRALNVCTQQTQSESVHSAHCQKKLLDLKNKFISSHVYRSCTSFILQLSISGATFLNTVLRKQISNSEHFVHTECAIISLSMNEPGGYVIRIEVRTVCVFLQGMGIFTRKTTRS